MLRHLIPPLLIAVASTLALSCSHQPTQPTDAAVQPGDAVSASQSATSAEAALQTPDFDPKNFVSVVDNPFFSLRPGTRFVYLGKEDGRAERVVTDVTHLEKTILGVKVVTVLDRVFLARELKEKTFDWYAQDKDGNVWYFGEDTKEYENGKVVSTAGSFEAGRNGARAGIIMLAHPHVGDSYRQEFARGVAEDRARVLSLSADVSVPYGRFHDCLKIVETTPLEPGAKGIKLHCRGVGLVKEADVSGGTAHIALVRIFR